MTIWEEKTLDELGKVARGKSRHRPRNATFLYGGPYPFIQTSDVKNANFKIREYSQTYSEEGLKQSKLWPKDTLCVTIAANIADTAILGFEACFPDSILGFIPYKTNSDVRFIKYCFDILQKKIQQISQGAAQDNLSLEKLLTVKFLVPDYATQFRIASILSAYDDLIENNLKRIKLLEKLAQCTYEEWFVKFRVNGKQMEVNTETGLPVGWGNRYLKDCPIYIGDGNYSSKYPKPEDFIEKGIPFFSTKEMINGRLSTKGVNRISEIQHSALTKGHLKYGDILLTTRGSIGKVAFVDEEFEGFNISAQLVLLRCDNINIYSNFLFYQMSDPQMYLRLLGVGTGTAQPQLPIKTLKLFKLLVPKAEIQKQFHAIVIPIMQQINVLSKQNCFLKESRDILLPRFMSGKIEVEGLEEEELSIAAEPETIYKSR